MNIYDLCNIIQDTSKITITLLQESFDYELFCSTWKFHEEQKQLNPHTLQQLVNMLPPTKVLLYRDCYRIHFSFLWLNGKIAAIGPYCTEMLSEVDYKILVKQTHLANLPAKEVLTYRSKFPITDERNIMHLVQCLDKYTTTDPAPRIPLHLDSYTFNNQNEIEEPPTYKPFSAFIQERYEIETKFMENIRYGRRNDALKNWRELHDSVDYLKHSIGYTLENARISAAVTRTIIRIAGTQAGLPAELSDWMTGESAKMIRQAKNIEEINKEHEKLIQAYCNAIHSFRTKKYSSLVLSCIYYIEHHYQHEIVIMELAKELDVSVNHLIHQFKKETECTPGQYLKRERLQHATWLLASSELSIQDISSSVGIPDANYFAKQFHQEFQETPSEYRRKRKL